MTCSPQTVGLPVITGDAYREKYGFGFTELHLMGAACPPCARVFAIGRREVLP
jgi:uncharacterized OB-fold protein